MVFAAQDRILIKNLYLLKVYNCTRLLTEFPEINWKKGGLKKLLRKIRETGGCDRRSEAAFDRRVGQSGAKRHRRRDRSMAFSTSCLCPCERGTLRTAFVTCT